MGTRLNRRNRAGVLHYVTLNTRDQRSLFRDDAYARAVLKVLRVCCDAHPARLIAYVTMPTHLHVILNPRDGALLRFLSQYKPAVTNTLCAIAEERRDVPVLEWLYHTPDGHPQSWQDGKHSLELYSDWMIWQKINYIHHNPLRKGLVTHANAYPYSSFAAMYQCEGTSVVEIDRGFWWEE